MELSRRDALAALSAAGLGAATGGTAPDGSPAELTRRERDALVAVARVVYPTEVEGVPTFVETYVAGRVADRPDHRAGLRATLAELGTRARGWFGAPVADLPPDERDALLRQVGADAADPDPDGRLAGRVRYYVVNDLLYALYTSPAGGRLVGTDNPTGHPGGLASYRRGPDGEPASRRNGTDDRPHGGSDE